MPHRAAATGDPLARGRCPLFIASVKRSRRCTMYPRDPSRTSRSSSRSASAPSSFVLGATLCALQVRACFRLRRALVNHFRSCGTSAKWRTRRTRRARRGHSRTATAARAATKKSSTVQVVDVQPLRFVDTRHVFGSALRWPRPERQSRMARSRSAPCACRELLNKRVYNPETDSVVDLTAERQASEALKRRYARSRAFPRRSYPRSVPRSAATAERRQRRLVAAFPDTRAT